MIINFGNNPPSLAVAAVVVAIGLVLIIAGAVQLGIAIIAIFAAVSALELFFTKFGSRDRR